MAGNPSSSVTRPASIAVSTAALATTRLPGPMKRPVPIASPVADSATSLKIAAGAAAVIPALKRAKAEPATISSQQARDSNDSDDSDDSDVFVVTGPRTPSSGAPRGSVQIGEHSD